MGAHSRKAAIRDRVETKLLLKLDGKETTAHPHPVDVQPHLQENSAPTIDLSLQKNQFFYLFPIRDMAPKKGGAIAEAVFDVSPPYFWHNVFFYIYPLALTGEKSTGPKYYSIPPK